MPKPSHPTPEESPPQPLTDPTVPPMRDPPGGEPYRDPVQPPPNDPQEPPMRDPDLPGYQDPPAKPPAMLRGPVTGDPEWRPGAASQVERRDRASASV